MKKKKKSFYKNIFKCCIFANGYLFILLYFRNGQTKSYHTCWLTEWTSQKQGNTLLKWEISFRSLSLPRFPMFDSPGGGEGGGEQLQTWPLQLCQLVTLFLSFFHIGSYGSWHFAFGDYKIGMNCRENWYFQNRSIFQLL